MPGFNRATASRPTLKRRSGSSCSGSVGRSRSGRRISALPRGSSKSAGRTPATPTRLPSSSSVRPTMSGSAPKRRVQRAWLISATGGQGTRSANGVAPRNSSFAVRSRPATTWTPRTRSRLCSTSAQFSRSGCSSVISQTLASPIVVATDSKGPGGDCHCSTYMRASSFSSPRVPSDWGYGIPTETSRSALG